MRKLALLCLAATVVLYSCKKTDLDRVTQQEELLSTETIDAFIKKQVSETKSFEWSTASDQMVWSALQHSDQVMSIGYKPASATNVDAYLHNVDINSSEWKSAREQLLAQIVKSESEGGKAVKIEEILQWDEQYLPVINIIVKNPATIKMLRKSKLVRYAEPMGYEPRDAVINAQMEGLNNAVASSSGCGSNTAVTDLVANADYTTIAPNTKQSWNYGYHGIPQAWAKSTGAGVKVFVIDSGCEFDQENLGSAFNQGQSSGRTVEKIVTLPRSTFLGIPTGPVETADDGCGHGTAMAGALAAPRGTDGNTCGIAYNCNLVTCRAAEDVFIESSREAKGVSDAFTNAANRADVKIISMSMGRITSSSQVRDAIIYAYGKGKLIFCAAGTSFSWTSGWYGVIFPATLTQVNAVTGVKESNAGSGCDECHDGSQTDFTIVMQRAANGRRPLSLAMSGNIPSTVGGSSVATASAAGIAALVWAKNPSLTRDQILNKLVQTSANYPTKSGSLGWGNLNADAATN